jgi:hypothetical protein
MIDKSREPLKIPVEFPEVPANKNGGAATGAFQFFRLDKKIFIRHSYVYKKTARNILTTG